MSDRSTPNLPSRNFAATAAFYTALGFAESYRASNWMILRRGELILEFFPWLDLDPAENSFGCCLRLDDLDAFYADCRAAGIPERHSGMPRLNPPTTDVSGKRIGYLVDPDGTLARLVQN